MRILLVSDLHYSLPQFDWVVQVAPNYDLIAIAGDSLDISSPVALDAQTVVVLRYLSLLQQTSTVVVCSGNHDLTGPASNGEQSALWLEQARQAGVPCDGDSLRVGDALVTICPWWDGPLSQAETIKQLNEAATRRGSPWVWLYHWPPMDSPTCWTGRRHYGDTDVGGWIAEHCPDFVLTGHVHEPPFKPAGNWADRLGRTWVFNAGRQIGPVPAHIEIDLDAGTAHWYSLMGSESLRLDAEVAPARTVF